MGRVPAAVPSVTANDIAAAQVSLRSYARVVHGFGCPAHIRAWWQALREHRRLVITCPPEHAKTTWLGVMYPAWRIGQAPNLRVAIVCATERAAVERSRAVRATLGLPEYQTVFPQVRLAEPAAAADWSVAGKPADDPNPTLFACGVGSSSLIGHRVDVMILDDPMDEESARSPAQRQTLADWARRTMLTRITDHPDSRGVCIMTRWHQNDLAQVLVEAGWHHLNQPAPPEQPLWPERFGTGYLQQRQREMGTVLYNCMYMGDPSGLEGALFQRHWFRVVPRTALPAMQRTVCAWDLAVSERTESDYTCKATVGWGMDGHYYILDVWRARVPWPTTREQIRLQAVLDKVDSIVIETTAFQLAAVQQLRAEGLPVPVLADRPDRDKFSRALEWQPRAEQGLVRLVEGAWNAEWLAEVAGFPRAPHDDQVDATGMALRALHGGYRQGSSVSVDFGDPLRAYGAGAAGAADEVEGFPWG